MQKFTLQYYLNVTVACGAGISFDFLSEIKKKLNLKEKKKVFGTLEVDLKDKEKGMKLDKITLWIFYFVPK